jgi:hypothetical protein
MFCVLFTAPYIEAMPAKFLLFVLDANLDVFSTSLDAVWFSSHLTRAEAVAFLRLHI